jgi:hypothetical protein
MAKGLHREKISKRHKRSDSPGQAKRHAYLEVATALNLAVHGNDFNKDISKLEVSWMIDKILGERKAIMGFNGYLDRNSPGRITRGLKRMWDKNSKLDSDGSEAEWTSGRKKKEIEKARIANGGKADDDEGKFIFLINI